MKLKGLKFKNILNVLKRNLPLILLVLILIIVTVVSIKPGKYILSNDNYSPELNPPLSVSRYLQSPAWRGYRVLGFASDSEQADIFRSIGFSVLDLFLPSWSLSQIFSFFCLFVGTISMAYLSKCFVSDFLTKKHQGLIFFLSGIIYLTTLWTAWVFNFNMMPYISQYGFLPLLLLSTYLLLKKWNPKTLIFFLISLILFTSTCVISTLFFVDVVLFVFFTIYFGILHKAKSKHVIASIGIFLISQIFWLIPFVHYTYTNSRGIIESYTNRAITANTIDLEAQMITAGNSARLYTRLLGTVDDPSIDSYIFPMSKDFQEYDVFKVIGLIPFILSVCGLVFILFKKKWKLIPLWVLFFGTLFIMKNQNPPFGSVYLWLQENIPLFKQVFRWVSSKLGQVYLILLVLTSSVGYIYIVNFFGSFFSKKWRKILVSISVIIISIIFLFYAEYLFKGQLFTSRAAVNLPDQYYLLKEEISKDTTSRIFYAPPANNGYFREYDWGFIGSQFLGYIIPNPIVDMSLSIGSDVGEKAVLELTNDFNSGNITELNSDLEKYNIKYILVDRSLVKGRYGYSLNWDLVNAYTSTWDKVWSQDFLELYQLKESSKPKYVESYGESNLVKNGSFVRSLSREPQLSPLSVDLSDAVVDSGYLEKEFKYSGIDTILYPNFTELDINLLPSYLKKNGREVMISPSLPIVNDIKNESYKKFIVPTSEPYTYLIDNIVLSEDDMRGGINLYNTWGSLNEISVVEEKSMQIVDLTETFLNAKPGDCSGGNYKILPDIKKQNVSSGFVIEGSSKLPCVYTDIDLNQGVGSVYKVHFNWESSDGNLLGYCLYSSKYKGCLNREKFLYTDTGFGNVTITIPRLIDTGLDDISLTIYALQPKGGKSSITIRNVELLYSSEFIKLSQTEEYIDTKEKLINIRNAQTMTSKIPLLYGDKSYIFNDATSKNLLWQPSVAEDPLKQYEIAFDSGLKQVAQEQYINQYQELFLTEPLKSYLWYWKGENVRNVPATVCLTYERDDKCYLDSTFYDDITSSEARIFVSSKEENKRLDASFNSISFKNVTENILHSFVVMEIPDQWMSFNLKPILPLEYTELQASTMFDSFAPSFYILEGSDIQVKRGLISIPQAKSDGWVAVVVGNSSLKLLNKETRVYINGWKQGWDISGINDIQKIVVFYWPNLLSYLGYLCILIIFIYFSFLFFKQVIWKNKH
ncbi:MAG TPA: hypothetical protein PLW18_01985 [Candidatus Dojkabacteria bacterium]|nr:hypothetical protein [Candidatus Dojkabacteria bacterium]